MINHFVAFFELHEHSRVEISHFPEDGPKIPVKRVVHVSRVLFQQRRATAEKLPFRANLMVNFYSCTEAKLLIVNVFGV